MFKVGEYVVYGNKGVCQIKSVGPINMPGVSKDRIFYTMTQVYIKGSTIFTPVDAEKQTLRPVLSKEEATRLIEGFGEISPDWISDDKERDRLYTDAIRSANSRVLCEMIIALYRRRLSRIADGKKATSTDERYYHAAEDILYGELGIALGIGVDEVKNSVMERVC